MDCQHLTRRMERFFCCIDPILLVICRALVFIGSGAVVESSPSHSADGHSGTPKFLLSLSFWCNGLVI